MTPQRLQTLVSTGEAVLLYNLNRIAYSGMLRSLSPKELEELREAVDEGNVELGVIDAPETNQQG